MEREGERQQNVRVVTAGEIEGLYCNSKLFVCLWLQSSEKMEREREKERQPNVCVVTAGGNKGFQL